MKNKFHVLCRDSITGMEFDFELDSTNRKAAVGEANCKYRGIVRVYRYYLRHNKEGEKLSKI